MERLPVIAIFGPTASGKTAVAEAIAERVRAEVISADAMQVYRGLPILTNQPERPARLVGIWPLDHEGSVGEFAELAHAAIDDALAAGMTAIVAGGTGLYFRAALAELEIPPAPAPDARERWERAYERLGPERAHAALAARDPAAAAAVHPNDRRRVVRALELAEAGSSLRSGSDRLWSREMRHETVVFALDVPRDVLARRIAARTREMFERGAEEEVRRALARPLSHTVRQAIGLREIAELPREEAVAAIEQRTRALAAYQRKWIRRLPGVVEIAADRRPEVVADEILRRALSLVQSARS